MASGWLDRCTTQQMSLLPLRGITQNGDGVNRIFGLVCRTNTSEIPGRHYSSDCAVGGHDIVPYDLACATDAIVVESVSSNLDGVYRRQPEVHFPVLYTCVLGFHPGNTTCNCTRHGTFATTETCKPLLCTEPQTRGCDFSGSTAGQRSLEVSTFAVVGVRCATVYVSDNSTARPCGTQHGGEYRVSECTRCPVQGLVFSSWSHQCALTCRAGWRSGPRPPDAGNLLHPLADVVPLGHAGTICHTPLFRRFMRRRGDRTLLPAHYGHRRAPRHLPEEQDRVSHARWPIELIGLVARAKPIAPLLGPGLLALGVVDPTRCSRTRDHQLTSCLRAARTAGISFCRTLPALLAPDTWPYMRFASASNA